MWDRTGQDWTGPAQLAKTFLKMERLAMPDVAKTTPKSEIATLAVAAAGTRAVRDTSAGRGNPGDLAAESYVLVV